MPAAARTSTCRYVCAIALAVLLAMPPVLAGQWEHYGGDAGGQKYSPLRQITPANVSQLQVAWQYHTGELERHPVLQTALSKVQVNPILLPAEAGGHLLICTPFGRVVALDPARGTERWVYDPHSRIGGYATPEDPEGLASPGFPNCRGVSWWHDRTAAAGAFCSHRVFLATHDLRLIALDAPTGKPPPIILP